MKITNVSTQQYYRGIPLKGWDSIADALYIFAQGSTKGSRDTEEHQVRAVAGSAGSFGLEFYLAAAPHMEGASGQFIEYMLAEAKPAVDQRGHWQRSYDYDGMGVFFKTGVEITTLDRPNELYMLEIWAAYVGDKPEIGLADALGVPRTMLWSAVTLQVEPLNEGQFAFDFEQVLRSLDNVLVTRKLQGKKVASHFMTGDRYRSLEPFVLQSKDGLDVSIKPGRVENRFVYDRPGQAQDTWITEGATLYGLLDTSYKDETMKEPPTIIINIQSSDHDQFHNSRSIWQPERKQQVLDLTDRIAQVFAIEQ